MFLTYADQLEAYDAEVKSSLIKKQCHSSRALLLCTVLVRVVYQLDTPIVRSFPPLNSCVSDVKAHLRELQTTQSCVASERELILARDGLFDEKARIWLFAQSIALYLG